MTKEEIMILRGKKLCALDYGERRIGVAVCDEMHVVVSTRPIIDNTPDVLEKVLERCTADRIEAIIVGVPWHHDDRSTPIIERILEFVTELRLKASIPVIEADEAFSTKEARMIMVGNGTKKKKRQTKGVKDQVAAAVILRDVIEEIHSNTPQML